LGEWGFDSFALGGQGIAGFEEEIAFMSRAFEITAEDVQNALRDYVTLTESQAEKLFDFALDCDAVEKAALYGDEMEEQTAFAYEEIREQILGLKPKGKMSKAAAEAKIQARFALDIPKPTC